VTQSDPRKGQFGYALIMRRTRVQGLPRIALVFCTMMALLIVPVLAQQVPRKTSTDASPLSSRDEHQLSVAERLAAAVKGIPSISAESRLRRSLSHATFCLPQNVLGILYYGFAQVIGSVLHTSEMNEVTVVVTKLPFGVSLGRYIFIPDALVSERTVRHEYGHTMQGYRHGPFYLLLEGLTSFVRAAAALVSPTIAGGYYDHWPENEADKLGGVN